MTKLISTSQAATQLNVSKRWVIELLNTDKLKGQLVDNRWIITQEDLQKYISTKDKEAVAETK